MIISKKLVLYGFQLVLFCATLPGIVSAASKLRSSRTSAAADNDDDLITCRIFMRGMLYETETNEIRSKVQTFCGVVDEDGLEETHETHVVFLPEAILSAYESEIQVGALFISIQDAVVSEEDTVVVQQDSQVKVLNHQVKSAGRRHGRRLAAAANQTTGTRILKLYRVLASADTANDPPALAELETAVFGNAVSVKTQYAACSNGLLTWTNSSTGAAETVRIDRGIGTFTKYDDLVDYTIQFLKARGNFVNLEDIADNAIFAVPLLTNPASSQNGFIGQGDVLGRVSIFSHKWAGDHSTLMHELGHNFGLVHAGKNTNDEMTKTMGMRYANLIARTSSLSHHFLF
jgi:Gametolysin peptidase M11